MKHHIQRSLQMVLSRLRRSRLSSLQAHWKARRKQVVGMDVFPDTLWQRVAEFAADRTLASLEIAFREPDLSLAWKARDVSAVAI